MLTAIVDDLARLDQLTRDHASDSITIAQFNKSIQERIAALDACDQALVLAKQARRQEEAKLQTEKEAHARTRSKLNGQRFWKWIGWGAAATFAVIAASK